MRDDPNIREKKKTFLTILQKQNLLLNSGDEQSRNEITQTNAFSIDATNIKC